MTREPHWKAWYKTARWQRLRKAQLAAEPWCAMCRPFRIVPATVCDHTVPHRGDEARFWAGPFTSLCKRCHDSAKQSAEKLGWSKGVDASGMPSDPNHPWNRR